MPFGERVDRSGGPDACWPWMGARSSAGYGQLRVAMKLIYAHRAALEEKIDRALEPDELACHHCDNPPCCNPSHLYAGTPVDNAGDAKARGRSSAPPHFYGEQHHAAKLTLAGITIARAERSAGASICELARRYGVHRKTMSAALTGRTWSNG